MNRSWFLVALAAASGCALVKQLVPEGREERPSGIPDTAERVGGLQAMVAGVAIRDFIQAQIAETKEQGWLAPDGGVLPADPDAGWSQRAVDAHRCAHSPANFTTWLEMDGGTPRDGGGQTRARWFVVVMPSGPCNWPSYGGGADYEIDGETFEILRREFHE